jgi:hypothetical protein
LDRNLLLVYLDDRTIPTDIQEKFADAFAKSKDKFLSAANYDMNYLLAETRFISAGKTFEADIFKQFDI